MPRLGTPTTFFDGLIDEVRISRRIRYDRELTPRNTQFKADEDTLALDHFNEGIGDVHHDSSANKHDGKIVGAKWVKADGSPVPAANDYALKFGLEDSIAFDQIVDYKPDSFTIEAYVRPEEPSPTGIVYATAA